MSLGGGPKCGRCVKAVYFNEKVDACGLQWHKLCFKCYDCNKMLDSVSVSDRRNDDGTTSIYCKGCYGKKFGPTGYGFGQGAGVMRTDFGGANKPAGKFSGGGGGGGGGKFGGADKCPRCNKSVYAAEKIIGAGQSWHKQCFSCSDCKKKLDSTTVADKDGEIYCKGCYGKKYGPKGFGYGQGAGALTLTE
eukprot:gene18194-20009_t